MDLWYKKGYPTTTDEDFNLESLKGTAKIIEGKQDLDEIYIGEVDKTLDARNLSGPIPIVKSREVLKAMKINQVLEILTTDPGSKADIPAWAHVTGQELISAEENDTGGYRFFVRRLK